MSQPKQTANSQTFFVTLASLGLVILLFWEWLRPLPIVTDTHSVHVFLLFFVFIFVLRFLEIPRLIHLVLTAFLFLYFVNYLYFYTSFFNIQWLTFYGRDLMSNIPLLLDREWASTTFLLRTTLFFLFVWYLAHFLYTNVVNKGKIFLVFFATITYLATLDTFTIFNANVAILRTVGVGFLLMALLRLGHLLKREAKHKQTIGRFPVSWVALTLAIVLTMTTVAYAVPKAGPNWPDPVSFIQSYSETAGSGFGPGAGQVRRSGYGDSDQVLGGPFVQDDSVAFTASSPKRHYWRGESKDFYNGRGWENSVENDRLANFDDINHEWRGTGTTLHRSSVETELIQSTVRFETNNFSQIFYPGDIDSVYAGDGSTLDHLQARFDTFSGRTLVVERGSSNRQELEEYMINSYYPTFSVDRLEAVNMNQVEPAIQERYTQLPDTVPQRVYDLAAEVVEGIDNPYAQVREVEMFFRRNGYEYEITDVPVPGPDQDYVDQFLFETMRGYCDNFSTAMVVMLRTLDIPARWVKGFTAGDVQSYDDGLIHTEVRNSNAHSWVEVYFPGIGWVPFEPTSSFYSPVSFQRDRDNDSTNDTEAPERDGDDPLESERDVEDPREEDATGVGGQGNNNFTLPAWAQMTLVIIGLVLVGLTLVFWKKLLLSWAIIRYRSGKGHDWFFKAYEVLIRLLGKYIHQKHPSQTMREYVLSLEPHVETKELKPLTIMFESYRYGKNDSDEQKDQNNMTKAQQLWLAMMKRIKF